MVKKTAVLVLMIACIGMAKKPSIIVPSPTPIPVIVEGPIIEGDFVRLGSNLGTSVDLAFAKKALGRMNEQYQNGCLKRKIESHKFVSLKNIDGAQVKNSQEVYARYTANAPHSLDLRWYKSSLSKVIGYTYNYKSDTNSGSGSETKIWSNTKYIYAVDDYAAHLSHELSHQARAGGFVHYTIFGGSVPYDIGDLMAECLEENK